jgi:hypothetical protein
MLVVVGERKGKESHAYLWELEVSLVYTTKSLHCRIKTPKILVFSLCTQYEW